MNLQAKAEIFNRLQKEIWWAQGLKPGGNNAVIDQSIGIIRNAFPGKVFPLAALHEFIFTTAENEAATIGFLTGMLAALMHNNGIVIWVGEDKNIFPPALKAFGIVPDKVIFINLQKEKEILWAMEEALRCPGLAAVVGMLPEIGFTASRRLQLAVEQSRVTGFILRNKPRLVAATACACRWQVSSLAGRNEDNIPGIGFPCWNVALLKVKNGQAGNWQVAWAGGVLQHLHTAAAFSIIHKRKTG